MIKRILNVVGWIGTGLVFVAVAVSRVPAFNSYEQYAKPLAIAGLICGVTAAGAAIAAYEAWLSSTPPLIPSAKSR